MITISEVQQTSATAKIQPEVGGEVQELHIKGQLSYQTITTMKERE